MTLPGRVVMVVITAVEMAISTVAMVTVIAVVIATEIISDLKP